MGKREGWNKHVFFSSESLHFKLQRTNWNRLFMAIPSISVPRNGVLSLGLILRWNLSRRPRVGQRKDQWGEKPGAGKREFVDWTQDTEFAARYDLPIYIHISYGTVTQYAETVRLKHLFQNDSDFLLMIQNLILVDDVVTCYDLLI